MKKRQPYHRFTRGERRFIRRWYPRAMTQCIAHLLGLKTRQIENYVGRNAFIALQTQFHAFSYKQGGCRVSIIDAYAQTSLGVRL